MMGSVPYISIVGWVRNDGYMDGYLPRIRHAIRVLVSQLQRHRVPSEVIVVEWNPPVDRPLIADLLGDLGDGGCVTVRFVVVDGRYHKP